ncbi:MULTISPECIES: CsbD family protein [Actinomyces]|uniref:CsbD family protein n=1 Tax=Actinomyces respiraculi TaxID=2744574 RepID=A0A7T0LLD9_9ACTO|nr:MULTISPECIES: CsbD family protein [Actinomyces]QPL05488.1 CsbD family protein [Actinomyces respiraculi]
MSDNSTFDQVAGKIKETTGKVVGDKELETEGVLQNLQGKATEAVEDVKDTIKGVVDHFSKDDDEPSAV